MDPNQRRRRVRDLLLESLTVVLSILIAFGLDAWWDARRVRQDLDLDLLSILEEVTTTRATVLERVASFERVAAGAEALIAAMEGAENASTVVVPDTIAYLANVLPTLNPRLSALSGFISSGGLAAVEDRELRTALGSLPGRLEDAVVEIERQRDVFFSVHQTELGRDFDNASIIRLVMMPNFARGDPLPSQGDVRYPNRVLIRNHTRSRLEVVRGAIDRFTRLSAELQFVERLVSEHQP